MLKYIATGTGHSGTGYVARLLRSAGVNCGHEGLFQRGGHEQRDALESGVMTLEADSSWAAAPYVDDWPSAIIIHAVRHPLPTIRSLTLNGTGADNHVWQNGFIGLDIPHIGMMRKRRQTQYWVRWNAMITKLRPDALLYRVEDRAALLDRLGLESSTGWDDDRTNAHGTDDAWTWDDLPDDMVDEVRDAAGRYGYGA